jgi:hypothetical protein
MKWKNLPENSKNLENGQKCYYASKIQKFQKFAENQIPKFQFVFLKNAASTRSLQNVHFFGIGN